MPCKRRLIGVIGGLTMAVLGGMQGAIAGPVPAVVPKRADFVDATTSRPADDKHLLWLFERSAGNGVSLPVGGRMSFGFGYEYLTEEDLVFEVAETGAMAAGYDSHRVMVRARLRF